MGGCALFRSAGTAIAKLSVTKASIAKGIDRARTDATRLVQYALFFARREPPSPSSRSPRHRLPRVSIGRERMQRGWYSTLSFSLGGNRQSRARFRTSRAQPE